MKNLYINELESNVFNQVVELVEKALSDLGYQGEELEEMLQDALDSRLEDLSDLIDLDALN